MLFNETNHQKDKEILISNLSVQENALVQHSLRHTSENVYRVKRKKKLLKSKLEQICILQGTLHCSLEGDKKNKQCKCQCFLTGRICKVIQKLQTQNVACISNKLKT